MKKPASLFNSINSEIEFFPTGLSIFLFSILFCFFTSGIFAQSIEPSDTSVKKIIIIDRIIVTGNHKTKLPIITRELTFHEGDTLSDSTLNAAIKSTRENLMNIALFNFVETHIYQAYKGHADIHIEVTERWYLFPLPVFEIADRNFNEWWQKKDFSRVNYGINIKQENFRGMDEILQGQFIFGYSQRLGLFYQIPYINKKQNIGLTVGILGIRNHEINYDTKDNKILFVKDPDKYIRKDLQGYVRITKRKGLYNYYSTTFDFRTTHVGDTVIALNKDFFVDDFPVQNHIGIGWWYRYDRRDYQPYAQKGFLVDLEAVKTGFGILPHEPNLISLSLGFRKYQPLFKHFTVAGSFKGRITQRDGAPYFNQKALGYSTDYIRGYDFYVINGQDFILVHSTFRYNFFPQHIYQLPVINSNKFKKVPLAMYLNAFYDGGYVTDKQFGYKNYLSNSWQFGYGIGFDIVTYYDLVFRFEYAWNRLNEKGLFFRIGTVI